MFVLVSPFLLVWFFGSSVSLSWSGIVWFAPRFYSFSFEQTFFQPWINVVLIFDRSNILRVDRSPRQRVYLITYSRTRARECYELVFERDAEFAGVILDPVAQGMVPPEHGVIHIGTPDTPRASLTESDREIVEPDHDIVDLANSCDELDGGDDAGAPEPAVASVSIPTAPVSARLGVPVTSTVAQTEPSLVVESEVIVEAPVHSGLSDAMDGVDLQGDASVPPSDAAATVDDRAGAPIAECRKPNGVAAEPRWGSVMELESVDQPRCPDVVDSPASPDPLRNPRDMVFSPERRSPRFHRFAPERVDPSYSHLSETRVRFLLSKRREHERKIVKRSPDHPLRSILTRLLMEIANQLGDYDYRVPDYDPEYANRMTIDQETASLRAQLAQLERANRKLTPKTKFDMIRTPF